MSDRISQLNHLLRKEISNIILKREDFSRNILVTVSRVIVSPELSQAKVFVSTIPREKEEQVLNILKKNIYVIQQELNKKLFLKKVPKIVFYQEKQIEKANRIEELLLKIHEKDKK